MKLEDIKIGMKVKLLSKCAVDYFCDINDWFEDCNEWEDVQQIKKQGYGVVNFIEDDWEIKISDKENEDCTNCWCFLPSDLEPYQEANDNIISNFINNEDTDNLITHENKTPKEWLLTPKAIFIIRDSDEEYVVLGNNTAIGIDSGCLWDDDLVNNYTDDLTWYDNLPDNDIMSITYEGKLVWKRKEYMTLTDAIKTGKKLKLKDWDNFIYPTDVMLILSDKADELINLFTDKVWEVEK